MHTEDDIRAAYRVAVAQAPDPGSVLTAVRQRQQTSTARRGRPRIARRWITPIAAASAVLAVIAGSVVLGTGLGNHESPTDSPGLLHRLPPYYLALSANGTGVPRLQPTFGVIHSTLTGATLATIRPPRPYRTFVAVAGAPDDRTFVLAAQARPSVHVAQPTALFVARFQPDTRRIRLTALPNALIPDERDVGLAISPDGTKVAVEVIEASGKSQIRVYSLATGAVRVWSASGTIGGTLSTGLSPLSWGPGGIICFSWIGPPRTVGHTVYESSQDGVWLLDSSSRAGSLIADSRLAVRPLAPTTRHYDPRNWESPVEGFVAPNGKTIVVVILPPLLKSWPAPPPHVTLGALQPAFSLPAIAVAQFSAATGRQVRAYQLAGTLAYSVLWSNSLGSLIVGNATATTHSSPFEAVIGSDRVVRLPGSAGSYVYYPNNAAVAF
jgi:hypothetical protein